MRNWLQTRCKRTINTGRGCAMRTYGETMAAPGEVGKVSGEWKKGRKEKTLGKNPHSSGQQKVLRRRGISQVGLFQARNGPGRKNKNMRGICARSPLHCNVMSACWAESREMLFDHRVAQIPGQIRTRGRSSSVDAYLIFIKNIQFAIHFTAESNHYNYVFI